MDMDKPISLRFRLGIKNVRNRLRKSGLHRFGGGSGKVGGGGGALRTGQNHC